MTSSSDDRCRLLLVLFKMFLILEKKTLPPVLFLARVLLPLVAPVVLLYSITSFVVAIRSNSTKPWGQNYSSFIGFVSLFISILSVVVAIQIERKQAEQAERDKRSQFEKLNEIDSLSSSAAREAEGARLNSERILRKLQLAEEFKRNRSLSWEQGERVERVLKSWSEGFLAGARVLWVDDTPDSIFYERDALELAGIATIWVGSTGEALNLLAGNKFDVVISDMERHENSKAGYDLLESMRQKSDYTPFIIYSSSRLPEHITEALERGGRGATNDPAELFELVLKELS